MFNWGVLKHHVYILFLKMYSFIFDQLRVVECAETHNYIKAKETTAKNAHVCPPQLAETLGVDNALYLFYIDIIPLSSVELLFDLHWDM